MNLAVECNSIELAQAAGLPFSVPQSLQSKFPYLAGRATLKFTIKKRPGVDKLYVLDAETRQDAVGTFVVDLDGYSAPVTAGQLLKNVVAHVLERHKSRMQAIGVWGEGKCQGHGQCQGWGQLQL